ncbi:MAG: hypothetical protein KJ556_04165 [Gammaproteobacteria bacterium]|nr:hypothetical protein [Gammaproteobacteria bacterium]MBU2057949.1 hypothetical protein [Gammaproteobacteria bacterium]MBU2174301.1 hypothetical protein [Gammaproteobacteria bacterium]MBU2247748.1 hypothetical protein [Gammaproteobacteria bacterium]MBU2344274.1 hypothetical protein [Gammaproteobacteria bacterium]
MVKAVIRFTDRSEQDAGIFHKKRLPMTSRLIVLIVIQNQLRKCGNKSQPITVVSPINFDTAGVQRPGKLTATIFRNGVCIHNWLTGK